MATWTKKISVLPIFIFILALAIIYIFNFGKNLVYNPPYLLLSLNTIFLTGTGIAIAVVSAKSFLNEGSNAILILGLATAVGGLAALIAGLAANLSVNYNVAVFNIGILISGGLQLLSAVIAAVEANSIAPSRRKKILAVSYFVIVISIAVITFLVFTGFSPTFFTFSGPTLERQWVIGGAITLFTASSILFGWKYYQLKYEVLFWYMMALALFAIGLFAAAVYGTPNAIFNWTARIILYVAGFYFLFGLLSVTRPNAFDKYGRTEISERWAEAFRSDRQQVETLFSKMLNGFSYHRIIVDKNGRPVDYVFLAINDMFEKMTGLKRERVLGKRATEVLPGIERDPADWIGIYGRVALSGEPAIFESYAESLKKWFSVSAYSPNKGYFVTIFEDITSRKEAENEIQNLAKFPSENPDPVCRISKDGNFLYCNKAAQNLFGTLKTKVGGVAPESWTTFVDEAFASGKKKEFEEKIGERTFVFTVAPVGDYVNVYGHDLTARKIAEDHLLVSEEQFRKAIKEAPIPIIMQAEDGNVLQISDAWTELTGYSQAETPTFDAWLNQAVYGEGANKVKEHMRQLFKGSKRSLNAEFSIRTRKGEERYWIFSASSPGKLADGRRYIVGMAVDITDLKNAQRKLEDSATQLEGYASQMEQLADERARQLKDAERLAAIGQTAGMVGHDIRNPLQSIIGDVYLAREDLNSLPDGEEKSSLQESLKAIGENVGYINKIVADLQDFAKPLEPYYEEIDIKAVIKELLKKDTLPSNIKKRVKIGDNAATVLVDSAFLKRIIGNLVWNAVQAMPKGGKLSIKVLKDLNDTVISVADTGMGIPDEIKTKLFTPLFTTKSKGQGFGLAVVKRMTDALGGMVTFESKVGEGTTFIIRLPSPKEK